MKNFNEIYEQIYKESNEELETIRKSRVKRTAILLIITIITIIIMILIFNNNLSLQILLYKYNNEAFVPIIFMIFFIIFMIFVLYVSLIASIIFRKQKNFIPEFKKKVIEPFIKNIDENLKYYPKQGISSSIYDQGEFELYDRYHSEDYIKGILDGKYAVKMAEVHTENVSSDQDGETTTTLFHGIFGNVECCKNITTSIKIHSDKGALGRLFKGKTRVEMDSSEFEKYFDVFSKNKIITMQILTADIMQMLIDFKQESKIKYEITIKKNQMYIRFHTGGVFEPKLFKSSLDYKMLKKYYDIIDFVFKVTRAINKVIENADI